MMSSKQHLRNNFYITLLTLIILSGCEKEPETKKYVARVNDSFLTEEDISLNDSLFDGGISRNEVIRNWIEKELLYQEALKLGIANSDEFKKIIYNSSRELASSMVLNKYIEDNLNKPSRAELQKFYNDHQFEFRADDNIYVYDIAILNDENAAISFRTKLIETNWDKTINNFKEANALLEFKTGYVLSSSEIYPIRLLNLIDELNFGEVSIVLEEKPQRFLVVRLLQKYEKDSNPPFDVIADDVEARYTADKRDQILRAYLDELYSKNTIEIKTH